MAGVYLGSRYPRFHIADRGGTLATRNELTYNVSIGQRAVKLMTVTDHTETKKPLKLIMSRHFVYTL